MDSTQQIDVAGAGGCLLFPCSCSCQASMKQFLKRSGLHVSLPCAGVYLTEINSAQAVQRKRMYFE